MEGGELGTNGNAAARRRGSHDDHEWLIGRGLWAGRISCSSNLDIYIKASIRQRQSSSILRLFLRFVHVSQHAQVPRREIRETRHDVEGCASTRLQSTTSGIPTWQLLLVVVQVASALGLQVSCHHVQVHNIPGWMNLGVGGSVARRPALGSRRIQQIPPWQDTHHSRSQDVNSELEISFAQRLGTSGIWSTGANRYGSVPNVGTSGEGGIATSSGSLGTVNHRGRQFKNARQGCSGVNVLFIGSQFGIAHAYTCTVHARLQ